VHNGVEFNVKFVMAGSEDLMHGSIKMAAEIGTIKSISFSKPPGAPCGDVL